MALINTLFTVLIISATINAQNNYYYEPSTSSFAPAFWTITTRLIDVYSESPYTYYNGEITTETYLETRTIKSDVTPTVAATFTTTYADSYSDVEVVYLYYPTGVVTESDLVPTKVYGVSATTSPSTTTKTVYDYYMPVTMTAPSSCPTVFTVTSVASVDIPRAARELVTATSVATGSTVSDRYGDTTVSETWYLSGGAAPYPTTNDFNYYAYIESCYTPPLPYRTASPTPSSTTGGGLYYDPYDPSSSSTSSSSSDDSCYWGPSGCLLPVEEIIIIVCSIVGGFFLLGFLESWFWFRRLMHGRTAMRLGTVCWILITLFMLCATRTQDRRTKEDQVLLAEKWKEMKAGAKFKAWMKYGFRHRYPEEHLGQFSRMTVGIVPPGEPLPEMEQPPPGFLPGPQVFYYGPQWAVGPNGQPISQQGFVVPPGQHAGYNASEMTKQGLIVGGAPIYPQLLQPVHAASRGATNITASSPLPGGPGPTPPPKVALPALPPRPPMPAPQPNPAGVDAPPPPQAPRSAPPPPPVATPEAALTTTTQDTPPDAATENALSEATQEAPLAISTQKTSLEAPTKDAPLNAPTKEEVAKEPTQGAPPPSATQDAPQLPPIDLSESSASKAPQIPNQPSAPPPPKSDPDNKSLYD